MTAVRVSALVLVAACVACSSESDETTPVGSGGSAGAGGCAPGEAPLDDGSCMPAGLGSEDCAEGFEHDGLDGCYPVLPDMPCPPGQMAVPGDSVCADVAPCGQGTWGDIAREPSTQHVDAAASGNADGSETAPWTTIQEGIDATMDGGQVAIAAGQYNEALGLSGKTLRVVGRCPAMVELLVPAQSFAGIDIRGAVDGSVISGLAITGAESGVASSGSLDVHLERVWIHDTARRGVGVQDDLGNTELVLERSLIERATDQGVFIAGAVVRIDQSVVRGTTTGPQMTGRGVEASYHFATDDRAELHMTRSVVRANHESGVAILSADATIEGSVVRDTLAGPGGIEGRGLLVQPLDMAPAGSTLTMRGSLVDNNRFIGIHVSGSPATIETTVVRGTLPQDSDMNIGFGLNIRDSVNNGLPATLTLRSSLVVANHMMGVSITGAEATIESTVVRDQLPNVSSGAFGDGIGVQPNEDRTLLGSATVLSSRIERNHSTGMRVLDGAAVIQRTLIATTLPSEVQQLFGDGLTVATVYEPASVDVTMSQIEGSARAGLSNFGSMVTLGDSRLRCNPIDLASSTATNGTPQFDDRGGNVCGCDAEEDCKAISSDIEPPPAIE